MPREGDIFRKIAMRMWNDEKVRNLSRPPPNGLDMWIACIAGEQTDIIPGLFKIGEAAWAEQLGWDLKGFREAFREVFEQGLVEVDWKARLVWVPNGLRYNPPASTKVILHWRIAWGLLPECDLKTKAWSHLREQVKALGEAWLKAFDKACPKASGKQKQQQQQKQQETQSTVGCADAQPTALPEAAPAPVQPALVVVPTDAEAAFEYWRKVMGKNARTEFESKRRTAVEKRLASGRTLAEVKGAIDGCRASAFNMGANDRRRRFDDLELICRDATKFDNFLESAAQPPIPLGADGLAAAPPARFTPLTGTKELHEGPKNEWFTDELAAGGKRG